MSRHESWSFVTADILVCRLVWVLLSAISRGAAFRAISDHGGPPSFLPFLAHLADVQGFIVCLQLEYIRRKEKKFIWSSECS